MLNQKYYPFERNRYYYGKLLTAKDFENEQVYFNNKRRLVNKTIHGMGIICGLNTYMADDVSLIIETGAALDYLGREIVISEPLIKKITTIEGFEHTKSDQVYLGISYDEALTDKAYAPMNDEGQEDGMQFNKVRENYRLFIEAEEEISKPNHLLEHYVSESIMYKDADVIIRQYTPKFVSLNDNIEIRVEIEKICVGHATYDLEYCIDLEGFKTQGEQNILKVHIENCALAQGEKVVKKYILSPSGLKAQKTTFRVRVETFYLDKLEEHYGRMAKGLEIDLTVTDKNMWDFILQEHYSNSLDSLQAETSGKKVWLAKINLIRTETQCVIDKVEAVPFNQYIYNGTHLMIGEQLKEYYPKLNQKETIPIAAHNESRGISFKDNGFNIYNQFSTGVVEIPVGFSGNMKEPILSDEIMHGLGKGTVYVDLGVEYIREDEKNKQSSSEIIYGQANVFDAPSEQTIKLQHGVKVFKEKGTFIIGIKLQEAIKLLTIRIRWVAFKLPEGDGVLNKHKDKGKMMQLTPDTIVISPRGTITFSPVFFNTASEPCRYEVIENDGGTVTNMGVYTAPSKEGVYTIKAQTLADNPLTANAFVVVKQQRDPNEN
jgi:hypothetical protein